MEKQQALVAYSPVGLGKFELNNEPETWNDRDTRVVWQVTLNGVKYAELRIGGLFMVREPIQGQWFENQLVQDAMRACGYHK